MSNILSHPCTSSQNPYVHPLWCDPRSCHIADLRADRIGLLLVHAVVLWTGAATGRRLELTQVQTLTDDGHDVLCTMRPGRYLQGGLLPGEVVKLDQAAAERLAHAEVDEFPELDQAWRHAADLARTGGSVTPCYVNWVDALMESRGRPDPLDAPLPVPSAGLLVGGVR